MKIEVGKKYQDAYRPEWTIEILRSDYEGYLCLYPSGFQQHLSAHTIEALYEPFEETPCDN